MAVSAELASMAGRDVFSGPSDDLPTLEVSSSVDYMIFRAADSLRRALEHASSEDATPYNMTMFLINSVPDAEWRLNMINTFNEMRKKYEIDSILGSECHTLCAMVYGAVVDWQAMYRGGTVKRLAVGTV